MRVFSLIISFGALLSGCADSTPDELCHSVVANTLCFEKYAGIKTVSSVMHERYLVYLTLWNGDEITIISDENREQACEVKDNLIFVNIGPNRLVVSPISWTKTHLDSSFRNVFTTSGKNIFAECNFDEIACISPDYDSAPPELLAYCQ